jgi:flotillin
MPRTIPRWGLVVAQPHEVLLKVRNGRVVAERPGGSCWRWPGQGVALVDTSVQRLQFTADQVTREKVGVAVTGLAVFRIVEPRLAWRSLDLAGNQYRQILQQMFVGATRRLVANLSLEECLTRRKDALATELVHEVAPVLAGSGRAEDATDRGWGVVLDTIEIQDVRVLSQQVFADLQAPYREELSLSALQARAEVEAEEARLAAVAEEEAERRRQERMELERARHEAERQAEQTAAAHADALERQRLEARITRADREEEARIARQARAAAAALERARDEAETARQHAAGTADAEAAMRAARQVVGADRLQELLLVETLPKVAESLAMNVDSIALVGDGASVPRALAELAAAARALGLPVPGDG